MSSRVVVLVLVSWVVFLVFLKYFPRYKKIRSR